MNKIKNEKRLKKKLKKKKSQRSEGDRMIKRKNCFLSK